MPVGVRARTAETEVVEINSDSEIVFDDIDEPLLKILFVHFSSDETEDDEVKLTVNGNEVTGDIVIPAGENVFYPEVLGLKSDVRELLTEIHKGDTLRIEGASQTGYTATVFYRRVTD